MRLAMWTSTLPGISAYWAPGFQAAIFSTVVKAGTQPPRSVVTQITGRPSPGEGGPESGTSSVVMPRIPSASASSDSWVCASKWPLIRRWRRDTSARRRLGHEGRKPALVGGPELVERDGEQLARGEGVAARRPRDDGVH